MNMLSVIPHIIDQHAEEASFLWLLRHAAVTAPHYDLADLAKLDDRVEAHLDGLRVAGDYGWKIAQENMQNEEPGEIFTAAVLALEGRSIERLQLVYQLVEQAPETLTGLISALGWVEPRYLQGKVNGLLVSDNALWRRVGIRACAVHRVDPGNALLQALDDEDVSLKCSALKAAGELGRVDVKALLLDLMSGSEPSVQFWAAWSAVLLGDRGTGLQRLQQEIEANGDFLPDAMPVALPVLDETRNKKCLKSLADNEKTLRYAIQGAGITGDPRYVPWLIKHMEEPKLARVAGEALSFICGVDLAYQDMECDLPAEAEVGPNENPDDDNVEMDPDEDLPFPDVQRVQQWWRDHSNRFTATQQYLYGQQTTVQHCKEMLRSGTQRIRYLAAVRIALANPEQPLFETRAVGKRQRQLLEQP